MILIQEKSESAEKMTLRLGLLIRFLIRYLHSRPNLTFIDLISVSTWSGKSYYKNQPKPHRKIQLEIFDNYLHLSNFLTSIDLIRVETEDFDDDLNLRPSESGRDQILHLSFKTIGIRSRPNSAPIIPSGCMPILGADDLVSARSPSLSLLQIREKS